MINGNERVTLLICQKRSIMLNTPGMSQSCLQCCASFVNNSGGKPSLKGAISHTEFCLLLLSCPPAWCWEMNPANRGKIYLENQYGNFLLLFGYFAIQIVSGGQVQLQLGKTLIPRRGMGEDGGTHQWCPCAVEGTGSSCWQGSCPCWPCCCLRRAWHSPGGEARALLVATLSPCSSSVIISQFLCFCVMQCKFLEAAILAMKDQLVVISGELMWLYPVVTESDPEVVYEMGRDCFSH